MRALLLALTITCLASLIGTCNQRYDRAWKAKPEPEKTEKAQE